MLTSDLIIENEINRLIIDVIGGELHNEIYKMFVPVRGNGTLVSINVILDEFKQGNYD
jgi:hypothetical protein